MDEIAALWQPDELDTLQARYARERERAEDTRLPWERAYQPFASQRRFHEIDARFKGFSGPVGSGKSKALAVEALKLAYANPGLPGLIGAPTYRMLADVTRAAFLETLEDSGIRHTFRKADEEVYLHEPQVTVRFRSLEVPTRLVGSNLAWFGVDELTYCKPDGWRRLEARLRHPKSRQLCGFAAWTPKGFDWVYQQFIGPERVQGYEAVLAAPGENVVLPDDFYDRLKASYDQKFYEQEVLGHYLSIFAGQVYYAFDRSRNVQPVTFDRNRPLIWSLDFNINPMASVIAQVVGERVNVLEEIILPNSNTPEVCRVFRERAQKYLDAMQRGLGHFPVTVQVHGDPAGNQRSHSGPDRSDWRIVRDHFAAWTNDLPGYFMVGSSPPTVKSRVNAMNAMLCNARGERRVLIDPSCKELAADFEQVAWKVDAAGNSIGELDKSDPKRSHVSDALGYAIAREFPIQGHGGPKRERLL